MRRAGSWKLLRQVAELRGVVELLRPFLPGSYGRLALGALLTFLLLGLRLAQPWPLKWILDGLTAGATQPVGPLAAGVLFLLFAVGAAALEYRQVMTLVGVGNDILYRFRATLFRHVLLQSLSFHERKSEGELLTRVVHDTMRLRKGINSILITLLQTLLTFTAVLLVLLWVDAVLAAVVAVAGSAALVVMARGGVRVKRAARKNRRREGKLAALVAEELIAIRDVQTFRREPGGGQAFERINRKSLKQESKVRRLTSAMLMNVEIIVSVGLAAILIVGARRVVSADMTAGELVLFASYAGSLYRPFFRFTRQSARLGTTLAAADRLRRLMRREPAIRDAPGAVPVEAVRGSVDFVGVGVRSPKKARGTRRWTLRGVDLHVNAGEHVAVVGGNGAGKSTLLRLVLRLEEPKEGQVLLDGRPLSAYTIASLRAQMSVVFQDPVFFGATVRENLLLGRADASDVELLDALGRARSAELVERLPKGLDTVVRKRGRHFSAGERQRLAIARALLRDAPIWLLDEPTTGLDAAAAESLAELLLDVTRGRTTFWITHDPRMALRLDRVVYLADGRVRFSGGRAEFKAWAERSSLDSGPDTLVLGATAS